MEVCRENLTHRQANTVLFLANFEVKKNAVVLTNRPSEGGVTKKEVEGKQWEKFYGVCNLKLMQCVQF